MLVKSYNSSRIINGLLAPSGLYKGCSFHKQIRFFRFSEISNNKFTHDYAKMLQERAYISSFLTLNLLPSPYDIRAGFSLLSWLLVTRKFTLCWTAEASDCQSFCLDSGTELQQFFYKFWWPERSNSSHLKHLGKYKLKGTAATRWQQLQETNCWQGKMSVNNWFRMKKLSTGHFLPPHFQRTLYQQYQSFSQGSKTLVDYTRILLV